MKIAPLLLLPVLALAVAACSPGDDGDAVISVEEHEPNDTSDTATGLGAGGFYTFTGLCVEGESADWFVATSKEGTVTGTIYASLDIPGVPGEFAADELHVSILGDSLAKLDELFVEDRAQHGFSTDVPAGHVYIQAACPGPQMYFQGTIHVP